MSAGFQIHLANPARRILVSRLQVEGTPKMYEAFFGFAHVPVYDCKVFVAFRVTRLKFYRPVAALHGSIQITLRTADTGQVVMRKDVARIEPERFPVTGGSGGNISLIETHIA